MQVNMSLVNDPLITITMFNDAEDEAAISKNVAGKKNAKSIAKKLHFKRAKNRLENQGAYGARVFPV